MFAFTEYERFAAQQLMALECDKSEDSARAINAKLSALGIPVGDWTFVQLLRITAVDAKETEASSLEIQPTNQYLM